MDLRLSGEAMNLYNQPGSEKSFGGDELKDSVGFLPTPHSQWRQCGVVVTARVSVKRDCLVQSLVLADSLCDLEHVTWFSHPRNGYNERTGFINLFL